MYKIVWKRAWAEWAALEVRIVKYGNKKYISKLVLLSLIHIYYDSNYDHLEVQCDPLVLQITDVPMEHNAYLMLHATSHHDNTHLLPNSRFHLKLIVLF